MARRPHPDADAEPLRRIAARRLARWARREAGTPAFARLLAQQATGAGGDALVALALAGSLFFSVPETTARTRVVLYLAITLAPLALVAPILARVLDGQRGTLRGALALASAGRAVCAWLLVARLDSLLLFPIAFAILALSRVALVARGAILPEAIPPGRTLVAANSSLAKTSAAAGIVVVPVGLGLLRVFGTGAELRFAGLVYLAGAVAAVALPRSRRAARAEAGPGPVRPIPARLRRAVVATAGLRFGVGFLAFHLAFGLRREHVGAIGLGVLIAAAALGALCGGAIAGRLRAVLAEDGIVAASLVLAALAAGAAGVWFGIAAAACLTGAFGLASGASKIAFDALLQSVTPEGARGRAFARYEAVWQLSWVAGALVPVAIALPLQAGVVAAGVLAAALGVLYALGSLRSARRPPRGATEIPPPRS